MMNRNILTLEGVGKYFRVYQVQKTLLRLVRSLTSGIPLQRKFWALKEITFDVLEGDKVAVIGRNGAGKTTLLRICAGIYAPSIGRIKRACPLLPLFRYGLGLNPDLSVRDNVFILGAFYGLVSSEVEKKLDAIMAFAELEDFLCLPVRHLSQGQIQRLSFSVFVQAENPFLAFDESTSLADLSFQKKAGEFFQHLMNSGKTILLASHDLGFIKAYCSKALWIEGGELREYGPAREVADRYEKFCLAETEKPLSKDFVRGAKFG